MLPALIKRLLDREDLTQADAASLLQAMLAPEATDAQIAAALVALAAKGETAEELAGFAQTMRACCAQISTSHQTFIDTCGTGGSAAKTFNVSTAAAFVVAAAGLPVAKHGNVGVTTKAGSADVLRALGIKVDLEPERVAACLDEIGICFMFAPLHHAATKRVAMVRRELGVRTIFNLLGPLTNPAGAPFQLIGVSSESACERVAGALARLNPRRAWVVRGRDGLDEITLAERTVVYEIEAGQVRRCEFEPPDFGLPRASLAALRGGSAAENAQIITDVLSHKRRDAPRDLIVINAAAALHVAGRGESLKDSVGLAQQAIDDGSALTKLADLRTLSNA